MLWRLTWLLENIKTYYLKKKSRHYLYKIDISRGIHCIVFKEYTMTQTSVQFSSVTQSYLTLRPHGLQHARPSCPSTPPGVYSNSCPLSQWCHPTPSSCHPLLRPPSIFPSVTVFENESALRIRWPKYWHFSFSISLSNEYSGLISFRMDWFDLLAVQGTFKSILQHHSPKASILWRSAFFIAQLSHPILDYWKNHSFD